MDIEMKGVDEAKQLASRIRAVQNTAPATFADAMLAVVRRRVVPKAKALTPQGSTGRLRGAITPKTFTDREVGAEGARVLDNLPYATTIHWGRKWVAAPGQLRRRGEVGIPNRVIGKRFIYNPMIEAVPYFETEALQKVERMIAKKVGSG